MSLISRARKLWVQVSEDRDLLDGVVDVTEDASYQLPTDDRVGIRVFDAVLTEGCDVVPVQLVLHELAHHFEYLQNGELSGHGRGFVVALGDLIDRSWSFLGLGSWSESVWEQFGCAQVAGSALSYIGDTKLTTMRAKWDGYISK